MRATPYTMCMVKFTPLSISPSNHWMERLSLIFPAFLSLIILLLILKRSLWTFRLFLWCFYACSRTGDPVGYMLCPFSVVLDPSQNLGPLSIEVMGWKTGGVRQRSPHSLFPNWDYLMAFIPIPSAHQTRWHKTKPFPLEKILPVEMQTKHSFPIDRKVKKLFHPQKK